MTTEPTKMGKATEHMPNVLSEAAWARFIQWAFTYPDIQARFREATGIDIGVKRDGIVALVDKVTGFRDDVMLTFIEWVTIEIWGLDYAPAKFHEKMTRKGGMGIVR